MVETPERISNEEVEALLEAGGKEAEAAVGPYDFAAQRINRTQLPLLEEISKNFAARAGAALTGLLGRGASMQFDSLESLKSADLQASLPVPDTLAVVRMKPLPGFAFVSVEPALLLTLLDGFFGGTGRPNADPQAAVAPAAQRFLALMLRSLAADLAAAWQPVSPMELELVKQETNPRLVQLGGAAAFVHLGFEDGDALGHRFERGELVEQEIVAALGDLSDGIRIACRHP